MGFNNVVINFIIDFGEEMIIKMEGGGGVEEEGEESKAA